MLENLSRNLRNPDQACKEYFLRTDIDLTSIIIGAAASLVPPMAYLDYTYYGLNTEFYVTASLEGLFILFSVIVIFYIRHNSQVKPYERLIFAWTMVLAVSTIFATFMQPARIIENVLISELLLIAIYMLITNKFSFRIIPAATITIACITALLATDNAASIQQKYLLILILLLLNAVGIIVAARNNRFKQLEYESQNRERENRRIFETLAASDPLTGILNRRSFLEHVRLALDLFKRYHTSFCLAIFDLDDLKQVNDTHGHLVGDEAIKQFANLVDSHKRLTDVFGRLGGDEFGFILLEATQANALNVISRMQEKLRDLTISSPIGDFNISFSAGVTEVEPDDKSPDDLIGRADKALYRSKGEKRDGNK